MAAMLSTQRPKSPGQEQALGWWIVLGDGNNQLIFHDGGSFGFASSLEWDPKARIGVVVLSNQLGDVSDIVVLGERFAIVKLMGMRPAEHRDISVADGTIRMRLWRLHRQTALETFVEQLRARIPTEVFYDRSAHIHMDPPERLSDDPPADEESEDPEEGPGLGEALGGVAPAAPPAAGPPAAAP